MHFEVEDKAALITVLINGLHYDRPPKPIACQRLCETMLLTMRCILSANRRNIIHFNWKLLEGGALVQAALEPMAVMLRDGDTKQRSVMGHISRYRRGKGGGG